MELKRENKNYFAPKTLNELKKLIKKNPKSNLLSGGTDLSLKVTKERKDIKSIIYLQSVKELDFIIVKKNKFKKNPFSQGRNYNKSTQYKQNKKNWI